MIVLYNKQSISWKLSGGGFVGTRNYVLISVIQFLSQLQSLSLVCFFSENEIILSTSTVYGRITFP